MACHKSFMGFVRVRPPNSTVGQLGTTNGYIDHNNSIFLKCKSVCGPKTSGQILSLIDKYKIVIRSKFLQMMGELSVVKPLGCTPMALSGYQRDRAPWRSREIPFVEFPRAFGRLIRHERIHESVQGSILGPDM